MSRRHVPGTLAIATTALFALSLLAAGSAEGTSRWLRCEYVESGAPGPADNLLVITGNDNAQVRREGDLVLVGTSAANGPRDFEAVPCGEEATVTNLDRIVYRGAPVAPRNEHQFLLDEREGPLGPGASPEPNDPEIEVEAVLPNQPRAHPRVQLIAGEGRDDILVDAGTGRLGVSLEPLPGARGFSPDADLTVAAPPRTVELKLHAGGGGDVLDSRLLDRRRGLIRSLLLAGDDGKDTLLGTEREDQLQGGAGPDRLFGRGGRDFLYPSAGSDITVGGPGADFISGMRGSAEPDAQPDSYFGGLGNDYIDARRGGADAISCGAGTDEAAIDPEDTLRGGRCEHLRGR
ncbi:MAG TPA: calcium-binding protein [Solirubrobacterales bacterium]|nr:calcium-binding protein [Solirubrobacterales bacterium]